MSKYFKTKKYWFIKTKLKWFYTILWNSFRILVTKPIQSSSCETHSEFWLRNLFRVLVTKLIQSSGYETHSEFWLRSTFKVLIKQLVWKKSSSLAKWWNYPSRKKFHKTSMDLRSSSLQCGDCYLLLPYNGWWLAHVADIKILSLVQEPKVH